MPQGLRSAPTFAPSCPEGPEGQRGPRRATTIYAQRAESFGGKEQRVCPFGARDPGPLNIYLQEIKLLCENYVSFPTRFAFKVVRACAAWPLFTLCPPGLHLPRAVQHPALPALLHAPTGGAAGGGARQPGTPAGVWSHAGEIPWFCAGEIPRSDAARRDTVQDTAVCKLMQRCASGRARARVVNRGRLRVRRLAQSKAAGGGWTRKGHLVPFHARWLSSLIRRSSSEPRPPTRRRPRQLQRQVGGTTVPVAVFLNTQR